MREDGHCFGSESEHRRYLWLRQEQRDGRIRNLEPHKRFRIYICEEWITTYESDFVYEVVATNEMVVEDVKGRSDGLPYKHFSIKKRLMKAVLGIDVIEVYGC